MMVQCVADPCVSSMEDTGNVRVIVVVHVDDTLIRGTDDDMRKVGKIHDKKFAMNNLGEVTRSMGCAVDREWKSETLSVTQTAFTETLLDRFEVKGYSDIHCFCSSQIGTDDRQGHRGNSSVP